MLVLPIGLDKNELRRTPWVSWVLIGSCFIVHFALSTIGAGAERRAERAIERSIEYLGEHPYLSPPPALLELLSEQGKAALSEAAANRRAEGEAIPPKLAEQEQQQLSQRTAEAVESLRHTPARQLGFVPARPRLLTLVSYTFLHGGWVHLLGNMLFLFLTGPFIEDLFGRPLFGALYFLSGVAGAGAFAAGAAGSTVPLVGASGAIAGVMGAFLVRLAARRIQFLVLPIPLIPALRFTIKLPAFVVIPLWAAEQLYYSTAAHADSPVAFSAHVGGFGVGVVFAFVVGLLGVEERCVDPAIERKTSILQNPAITEAADARVAGDLARARRLIDGVLRAQPASLDAWTQRWEIGLDAREGEAASQAGLRLIELHGRGPDRDMRWSIVNDPRWRDLKMTSRFLTAVADLTVRSGDAREAIALYRRIAAEAPAGDVAGLRAQVCEGELLARAGDPSAARRVFERARCHPACSEPWLERMEHALRVRPARATGP